MTFPSHLKYTLAGHSVSVDRIPQNPLSSDTKIRIEELSEWCGSTVDGVAVSYFFRQYALFVSAQFDLLANHNSYFACSWQQLQFDRVHNYGYHLLQIHAASETFIHITDDQRFEAMHSILLQAEDFIQEFRKHVKISPITLWENVLGSVIWLYANLEKRNPRRAAEDMEWLMDSANWLPIKTSYWAKLLGNTSLDRAVSGPLRRTCCLYKELPQFETCTFCPLPN